MIKSEEKENSNYPKAKQADEVKSLLKDTQVDIDKIIADKKAEEERTVAEKIEVARVEAIRVEVARVKAEKIKADQLVADIKEAARVEVNRVEAERAEANRIEANRLALAKSEGVRLGMSYKQVIESNWGRPKSIESFNSYGNIEEYWYYAGTNYLIFTNGHLTSIYNW